MGKLLVAQSGGPTAAINATVVGIVLEAKKNKQISEILGAKNGILGLLNEDFFSLSKKLDTPEKIELLMQTPAAILGSCRHKLGNWKENTQEYEQILQNMKKNDIQFFVYIGGNDSMDTVDQLSAYCKSQGEDNLFIMGAPKTIDNDLMGTDHCPGFGSAAKYIATTFSEIRRDCSVYQTKAVTIVEVMGRNAGWLTAAAALSRVGGLDGPDLIYLCEVPFQKTQFIDHIKTLLLEKDAVVIAVSEGIKDSQGQYLSAGPESNTLDAFGHNQVAGAANKLVQLVKDEIGCKVRSIELNLMQRCAGHLISKTDIEESIELGRTACKGALEGNSGKMAAVKRISNHPYQVEYELVSIELVANHEKKVPLSMINVEKNDVNQEMIDYLYPLIQGEISIVYEHGIPKHLVF